MTGDCGGHTLGPGLCSFPVAKRCSRSSFAHHTSLIEIALPDRSGARVDADQGRAVELNMVLARRDPDMRYRPEDKLETRRQIIESARRGRGSPRSPSMRSWRTPV